MSCQESLVVCFPASVSEVELPSESPAFIRKVTSFRKLVLPYSALDSPFAFFIFLFHTIHNKSPLRGEVVRCALEMRGKTVRLSWPYDSG